jgi:hypothetical protein
MPEMTRCPRHPCLEPPDPLQRAIGGFIVDEVHLHAFGNERLHHLFDDVFFVIGSEDRDDGERVWTCEGACRGSFGS